MCDSIESAVMKLSMISMLLMAFGIPQLAAANSAPLETVQKVDLRRYTGRWYEIARYPNRFQRNCESDTTAEYTLRSDSKVEVVNSCREKSGKLKQARGTAKVVDTRTNAKLKVTFFWPFKGDYWVIGLDPGYRYAIVGEPKRRYVWILSRTPEMDPATYEEAMRRVRECGYLPEKLLKTRHTIHKSQ